MLKKHVHENKSVIDKLSENEDGQLLYNGEQIATGPGGGGGSIKGTLTHIGPEPSEELAVGGFWFKTTNNN